MTGDLGAFLLEMPKCELHVHLEGTLEPELRMRIAARNGVPLPHSNVEDMRASYSWNDLPSFLNIFYAGSAVLLHEIDFYDLCYEFLKRLSAQNVRYVEMMIDPQHHLARGVAFESVMAGITQARADALASFGIHSGLIVCFMRDRSAESALQTLQYAVAHRDKIIGVGLDSDEAGNPPIKFAEVFRQARAAGFRLTAHCDVDQADTHAHIHQALVDIEVDRIDHGLNVLDREDLVEESLRRGITFTFCPHAIGRLRPGQRLAPIRQALERGLAVTINSDDPAYMKTGYLMENLIKTGMECEFDRTALVRLSRNAFSGAWLDDGRRRQMLAELDAFAQRH